MEGNRQLFIPDGSNPYIPNVLLVVTPQMRKLYYQFGQYIGFDLTFSLIRERPKEGPEYLVGVFAGTNESRKIVIYGLAVTNNQSTAAYKYLFREFIRIMGRSPQTIITDEEFALAYALRDLKSEGVFQGVHLLDTFHMLRKFRAVSNPLAFQTFRKMMHAKDRLVYQALFDSMFELINSDEEFEMLRYFDYNSDKYCFSQIEPSYVGIGISDSMNEKFHDLIKAKLSREERYVKAVTIILEVIELKNTTSQVPTVESIPLDKIFHLPEVKSYRGIISDKVFRLIIKEIAKTFHYGISAPHDPHPDLYLDRSTKLFITTPLGNYQVDWTDGKWHCICQFEAKSGHCCSHVAKILIESRSSFLPYFHERWLIASNYSSQQFRVSHPLRNRYYISRPVRMRVKELEAWEAQQTHSKDEHALI